MPAHAHRGLAGSMPATIRTRRSRSAAMAAASTPASSVSVMSSQPVTAPPSNAAPPGPAPACAACTQCPACPPAPPVAAALPLLLPPAALASGGAAASAGAGALGGCCAGSSTGRMACSWAVSCGLLAGACAGSGALAAGGTSCAVGASRAALTPDTSSLFSASLVTCTTKLLLRQRPSPALASMHCGKYPQHAATNSSASICSHAHLLLCRYHCIVQLLADLLPLCTAKARRPQPRLVRQVLALLLGVVLRQVQARVGFQGRRAGAGMRCAKRSGTQPCGCA